MTGIADDDWRERLRAEMKRIGRSDRSLSEAIGRAPGYINSILKDGKEPKIGNMIAICDELGVSLAYILRGAAMTKDDEEVLTLLHRRPDLRPGILLTLRAAGSPQPDRPGVEPTPEEPPQQSS